MNTSRLATEFKVAATSKHPLVQRFENFYESKSI